MPEGVGGISTSVEGGFLHTLQFMAGLPLKGPARSSWLALVLPLDYSDQ
jgi:hypothetical protein